MVKWILIILGLIGIDQVSKALVTQNMMIEETIPVIKDFFHITYTRNLGMVFGGLQGTVAQYYWVFLIFALVAVGVFGYMFIKIDFSNKKLFVLRVALALLLAGTVGNAIDRAFQVDHAVVDFIDFRGIWSYIFNFADTFLNVGIALFFIDIMFLEKKRVKTDG